MNNIDYSNERICSLYTPPHYFVGTKPTAVLFGDERVEVKTWRQVYAVIIGRCNENPQCHERLMYLRNKASGKVRLFLSDKPDSMTRPLRIDEELYGETHYGSSTMLHILVNQILAYTGFDYSNIRVVIKS